MSTVVHPFTGLILLTLVLGAAPVHSAELRIGIIGCDTSHVTAFTQVFNDASDKHHVTGGRVVVAFKGGSPDLPESANRVEEYALQLRQKYGVQLVNSVEELCRQVDVVLLESVDGRPHLEQVRPVFAAHKPVFIDKPVAGSLRDVLEIDRLAIASHTPWFSSSAYRYYATLTDLKKADAGDVLGAVSYGPCAYEPHHPDFFWYGIHPVEALFTVMGSGCESVTRTAGADTDVANGVWTKGRLGVFRGARNSPKSNEHGVTLFGTKAVLRQAGGGDDYAPMLVEVMRFFQTGVAPVSNRETIEIYAFMEAADESKRAGGKPVSLADVLKKNGG